MVLDLEGVVVAGDDLPAKTKAHLAVTIKTGSC